MSDLFKTYRLNAAGLEKAVEITERFNVLADEMSRMRIELNAGREIALFRTHLELACMYVKKAMAMQAENHES